MPSRSSSSAARSLAGQRRSSRPASRQVRTETVRLLRAGRRGAATAVAGQPPRVCGFEESAGVLCSASLAEVRSAQN